MLRNSQAIANIGQASAEIWQSYKRFINTHEFSNNLYK